MIYDDLSEYARSIAKTEILALSERGIGITESWSLSGIHRGLVPTYL